MISRASGLFPIIGSLVVLWVAEPVAAHRLAPVLWELREGPEGRVEMRWKTTLVQPTGSALRPTLPEPCESLEPPIVARDSSSATARWSAACGPRGLVGRTVGVEGLPGSGTDVVLRIELADGRRLQAVLSGDTGTYRVPESHGRLAMLADYAALGVRHILTGLDHLLFVFGLLLLVRGRGTPLGSGLNGLGSGLKGLGGGLKGLGIGLVGTITAFTLGHSVTLSLAVLGVLAFPTPLVEVGIAGSLLVLASQLARPASASPRRRTPWVLALGFGLLHGFGFAGALAEAGLPAGEIPLALLAFNAGIEAGQMGFVMVMLVLARMLGPSWPARYARVPAYAIGSLAAFWCFERAAPLLGG